MTHEPIVVTGPVYDRFRRGENTVEAPGFELRRIHFDCAGSSAPSSWDENERFVFPLFLPTGGGQFRDVVIILNGLNDTSYRKFFPWAASLASAGVPALIFPSAFLMNRRPREWISPTATERAWQSRVQIAPDSTSLINAVLSLRVAQNPRALLEDALRTAADLRQLVQALANGQLDGDAARTTRFLPDTRSHLLGYSMGGYIGLALRLEDATFARSKLIALCAGASTQAANGSGLDPVSPFILDRDATELLRRDLDSMRHNVGQLGALASTLFELVTGTSAATRERIRALGHELVVICGANDRIVPPAAVEQNLGRLDCVLPLGIHEYPFNLAGYEGTGVAREIARSHRVVPSFEAVFRDFIERVRRAVL